MKTRSQQRDQVGGGRVVQAKIPLGKLLESRHAPVFLVSVPGKTKDTDRIAPERTPGGSSGDSVRRRWIRFDLRQPAQQTIGRKTLAVPRGGIPQSEFVPLPDQIGEPRIGGVFGLKNGGPKSKNGRSRRVEVSRFPVGNPAIRSLVPRMKQQHQKYAD